MTTSATPFTRAAFAPVPVLLAVLAVGTALSPVWTKIAGATWLVWCLWGIGLRLLPAGDVRATPHPALPAAHAWAAGCAVAMGLAMVKAGYWNDPFDEVYAYLRLVLASAAGWWVLSRATLPPQVRTGIGGVVTVQCGVAFVYMVWLILHYPSARDALTANAISWAQAIAFCICLLMPMALAAGRESAWSRRLWWLGIVLGAATVLMSLSRGAYGVFVWMLWLLVARWRDVHGTWPMRRLAALAVAACAIAAAVWWAPGDPLRLRLAQKEIVQAETQAVYDTSIGNRLYLWGVAWQGLRDSPLIGVGQTRRMYLIQHAGEDLPPAQRDRLAYVRTMGHVHNQYLHAALDGGAIGLGAVLAVMLGLGAAAWRLRRVDPIASRQMQGLLFVHVAGGITNVNFAHNYYVVMLSVVSAIVLLGARAALAPAAPP